ncbi:uncharacterized protein LOC133923522 [Phragmites australis]|uniref:uncharacterized protein LOC133923522 n=1 Tax=Phragmites australis TaxID=29695 RepID=UPI002D764E85|nr:uncharacterized protein LOC133923522 [Phragmites australis]
MASPPPHEDAGAVCCMCGDRGLPHELFRCRSCRVRLQHRYCSDLYPRATAYRRCNWCLREPAEGRGAGNAAANNKPVEKRKTAVPWEVMTPASSVNEGCSKRGAAELGLGQPVKKNPKAEEGARKGSDDGSDANNSKEPMRAGKTRVRVKVRRYKLLAEVISC